MLRRPVQASAAFFWLYFLKTMKAIPVAARDSKLRQAQSAMTGFHPLETTRIVHNGAIRLPLRAGVAPYAPPHPINPKNNSKPWPHLIRMFSS
jgi:hypothetical protein